MKIFQLLNCCMPNTRKDFSNNSLLNCSTIQVQKKVFTLVGLVSANSPRSFRWTVKIIRVIFKPNQGSFFLFGVSEGTVGGGVKVDGMREVRLPRELFVLSLVILMQSSPGVVIRDLQI